jgi:drug/metabolite transporter (DMT)-like permease
VALAFGDALRLPTRRELVGDLMMLGGAALWAATTLLIKRTALIRISPNKVLFYQLAVSAALMPLASALAGEGGVRSLDAHVAWALAYQVVVVAFASYLAWFWLVSRHPAGRLAAISFLTPLFGVMAGALLLGESVSPWLAAAMALVCLGIYLVNRRTPPARTRSPDECTA